MFKTDLLQRENTVSEGTTVYIYKLLCGSEDFPRILSNIPVSNFGESLVDT